MAESVQISLHDIAEIAREVTMAEIEQFASHDNDFDYLITAQATGPTSAAISERKQAKADGSVRTATYEISGVEVIAGVLHGTAHLPAFQTESITLTWSQPNDPPSVTIKTGGLFFGVGAQTLGSFNLSASDFASSQAWAKNFPSS